MAAKQQDPKDGDVVDPYLESNKDPELEKKIDEMMNMDQPNRTESGESADSPAVSEPEPEAEPAAPELPEDGTDDSDVMQVTSDFWPSGAPADSSAEKASAPPLLPDELIAANLEKIGAEETDTSSETPAAEEPEPLADEAPKPLDEFPVPASETKDELGLEDVGTAKAVDEIIATDADELLAARDRGAVSAGTVPAEQKAPSKPRKGIGGFFKAWWHSKRYRYATLAVLFVALAAAGTVPASRYFVLNSVGVRSAASVTVLDETTGQPLKNAEFSVAGKSGRTDREGTAKLSDLRLGRHTMTVKKVAFAEVAQPLTLGWGSNPLGEFRLKPVGSQYKIEVVDFLSKKPVSKVEASSGEANALSNEKGEIVLTVPHESTDQEKIEVQLSGEGLRTENIALPPGKKDTELVAMVPERKHVFISNRSGTYDLYKVDADGKNEEKVLSGTGSERPDAIAVAVHPTKNVAALVSARDSSRNKDGFVLSSLTMVNLSDNSTKKVTQSERIQLIGWIDNKLAYVAITEGASAASPNRHRLISYDLNAAAETELASTNYFNDIMLVDKSIYYTPASYKVNGPVGLFKTNADGTDKKTIYDQEVWNLFRTSYGKLSVSKGQDWFDLHLNTDVMEPAASAPPVLKTRIYVPSPDNSISLWTDERDGKGVLLSYDPSTKKDEILRAQSGLKNPIRWLSDRHVIYRVNNGQETADYVFNTEGGEPRKIVDVTDTAGIDRWYYY